MKKEIQILVVEDMPADVVLINRELRKGGLTFRVHLATTDKEFMRNLRNGAPDVILSDHDLPAFDGFSALALAQQHCPDVPFLFVTGSMGEQVAIESLRNGATDYVLKSRLDALVPAVLRALRLAEERRLRREAEEALAESEDHFRTLVESVKDYAIFRLDADGHISTWNTGVEFIIGYRAEDILGRSYSCLYPAVDAEQRLAQRALEAAVKHGRTEEEGWRVRRDGSRFFASTTLTALPNTGGPLRGFAVIMRDETERRRAAEELRKSAARHTAIVESAIDAIISIDHEGLVREWNSAAVRLFQYSREDAVGRKIDTLIAAPALMQLYQQGLAQYLVTGAGSLIGRPIGMTARRADGVEFPIEMGIARIAGSSPALYSAVIRDMTAHQAAAAEVNRLNTELEQRVQDRTAELETANHELESFSYSVSHDLRAPLRHITGFVSMLKARSEVKLDAESRDLLQSIAASADRMSRLIEALLALSRTGRTELHKQRVSLDQLLRSVRAELRDEARDRQVDWRVEPLPDVEGDAELLRQVLVNLLSNALKYTRPRPVPRIEIGARREGTSIVCHVRDNGVGFDSRYSDKLFGVFQRLHRAVEFEGTGIGLATIRLIIQRHGGRVWAEGEADKGATFYFSLPATELPQVMKEKSGILVVDDDENDLRLIDLALKRGERPPVVRYLHDGGEVLDYLYRRGSYEHSPVESPDFILLDLHMPRVDGWEVLRQLKSDERLKWIPIVIFSSSAREMDVRHCYDLGANAYVVKPIDHALFQGTLTAIKSFWSGCNHSLRPSAHEAKSTHSPA